MEDRHLKFYKLRDNLHQVVHYSTGQSGALFDRP